MGGDPHQPERDQGDAALSEWFPRPASPRDLEVVTPSSTWTADALFELLVDAAGVEWRHKVGVAGPIEGSAKPTTRLLAARGWVCKLQLDHACASAVEARAASLAARDHAYTARIWHPDKHWLVMQAAGAWYPMTLCPELVTLRQIATFEERTQMWMSMLQLSIDVHHARGIGLDLNPANFATERGVDGLLFYLDDEVYDGLDIRDLAGAIAARVPEEMHATPEHWRAWGVGLARRLMLHRFTWSAIRDEIAAYPLPARYEPSRRALLDALAPARPRPSGSGVTCILADVHANVAALDAVLADARANGADRFLFLGDAVGYGPDPAACIERLAALPNAQLIRGNHDHAIASGQLDLGMNSLARACAAWTRAQLDANELRWLAALPTDHLEDGWLAVHGAPRDPHRFLAYVYELTYEDNLRHLRERRIPVCFYGHTHVQLTHLERPHGTERLPGVRALVLADRYTWLVNPGSVGQPRDGDPRAAYALWRRTTGELATLRVPYPIDDTVRRVRAAGLPTQLETRLRAGA